MLGRRPKGAVFTQRGDVRIGKMLKRIDHVGVVVEDLEQARRVLVDGLGFVLDREFDLADRGVRAAFYRCGDVQIELVWPTTEQTMKDRMGGEKVAHISHIAIEVDDVEAAAAELRQRGIEMTTAQPGRTSTTISYWTRPETSGGVMYQLTSKI